MADLGIFHRMNLHSLDLKNHQISQIRKKDCSHIKTADFFKNLAKCFQSSSVNCGECHHHSFELTYFGILVFNEFAMGNAK